MAGRPTSADYDRIRELSDRCYSIHEIQRLTGFSRAVINKALDGILVAARDKGGFRMKVPDEVRAAIRHLHKEGMYTHDDLARMHGCSRSTIDAILQEQPPPRVHAPYTPKPLPDAYVGSIPYPTKARLMAGR